MKKVVAFDFDQTSAMTLELWTEIKSAVADGMGLPLSPEQNTAIYFSWDKEYIGWGKNLEEQKAIYRAYYAPRVESEWQKREWIDRVALFPGMKDVMEELSETYRLMIVTSRDMYSTSAALGNSGVLRLFDGIIASDAGRSYPDKPHPCMLYEAMARAGVDPSGIVMIGDTPGDIGMGKAAGARTIGAGYGGYVSLNDLAALKPDCILRSVRDIPKIPELVSGLLNSR
ncbi:MAG: HAD family hydrolase [Rickettsiales bacterium]|jgi:HAD superfamily hydrolase (TIGR01509 family)|nr:HAD family hydrolase [Rickettsiales bacterium]